MFAVAGMSEVGVYRMSGVLRDVEELRQAFDTGMYICTLCCTYIMLKRLRLYDPGKV